MPLFPAQAFFGKSLWNAHPRTAPVAAGLWAAVEPGVPPGGKKRDDGLVRENSCVVESLCAGSGRRDARPLRQAGTPDATGRGSVQLRRFAAYSCFSLDEVARPFQSPL